MKPYFKNVILATSILLIAITGFSQVPNLIVGTYTSKGSKGIYLFNFDTATGKAIQLGYTDSAINPSFLTVSKDKQFVYAVEEAELGKLNAYSLQKNKLTLLQQKDTKGANPCYVTLSPDQHTLFVANYSGGSITSFHRFADGTISNAQQFIEHKGSSMNATRQEKAHVHGTFFSPEGNYVLTPDLGMDQVNIYPFKAGNNPPLDVSKEKLIKSSPGSGPRHLTFSKNGHYLYVIEELTGTIRVYDFNKGQATLLQTVLTHPADYKGDFGSADIHLSPDGLFLYASNRGALNNIVKFSVQKSGKLVDKQPAYYSTQGIGPRNFTLSGDGKWLLVGNQNTGNIAVFKRNLINGDLTPTGNNIKISMPVCLVFF